MLCLYVNASRGESSQHKDGGRRLEVPGHIKKPSLFGWSRCGFKALLDFLLGLFILCGVLNSEEWKIMLFSFGKDLLG